MTPRQMAAQIVYLIEDDLSGRSGFDGVLDGLDSDTRSAMLEEWRRIAERTIETRMVTDEQIIAVAKS